MLIHTTTIMAAELKKEDLIPIIVARGAGVESKLWAHDTADLVKMVGKLAPEEVVAVKNRQDAREPYLNKSIPELKTIAHRSGIPCSQRTKCGIIDAILREGEKPAVKLDEDQIALLGRTGEKLVLVSASAGAGKTMALSALAAKIVRDNAKARVCILAYNVNAETIMKSRLLMFDVRAGVLTRLDQPGVYVMTFNKYGYRRIIASNPRYQCGDSGYRLEYERALRTKLAAFENWDYLIIDESQDLLPDHIALVEQLRKLAGHVIMAGDGRQEIYAGASYFSTMWSEAKTERHVLRYNHRSTKEVVDFINAFSKQHFPTIHHDQICVRTDHGSVKFVADSDLALPAADFLGKEHPRNAYLILPVSVRKFNFAPAVTRFRQLIHERSVHPTKVLGEDEDKKLSDSFYSVGNCFNMKGSERRCVSVIGAHMPYENYSIPYATMLKLFFVAISRARDELQLVFPKEELAAWNPFAALALKYGFIKEALIVPMKMYQYRLPLLKVNGDVSRIEHFHAAIRERKELKPVTVDTRGDADFVAVLMEVIVARKCGVVFKWPTTIRAAQVVDRMLIEMPRLGFENGEFVAVYDPMKQPNFETAIEPIHAEFVRHPEYAIAALKYSIDAGNIWTISERLLEFAPDVSMYVAAIRAYLTGTIQYRQYLATQAMMHRAAHTGGTLVGAPTLSDERRVVEIRHMDDDKSHYVQAGIYAHMAGYTEPAMIVNTKIGFIAFTDPQPELSNVIRAACGMKAAAIRAAVREHRRLRYRPSAEVHISVDVETAGMEGDALIEIGAIAWHQSDIIGCFHRVAAGVRPTDPAVDTIVPDRFPDACGLAIDDMKQVAADQMAMKEKFAAWVKEISGSRVFVHWCGNDVRKLEWIGNDEVIDAFKWYKNYLELNSRKRLSGLKLGEVAEEIFGPTVDFAPHRAYEDCLLTAMIFVAITDAGGMV